MTEATPAQQDGRLLRAPHPRWVQSPKRVRAFFGGQAIVDTRNAHLLREDGPPVYYFPWEHIRADLMEPSSHTVSSPSKGTASYWDIRLGDRVAENASWAYVDPPAEAAFLKGFAALVWNKMDAWFEEEDEVFVHARDPFKRIDVLRTSQRIQVILEGESVADTQEALILLEPGHPVRYYLPKTHTRMDLLEPSSKVTRCPYKGEAHYFAVRVNGKAFQDVVWYYLYPTPECIKISGHLCFYLEQVDEILVDGVPQPKPKPRG